MFNFKLSGMIAVAAFILSFLLGLISRASMPMLFFRPVIFAFLFFAISAAARIIVSQFLPELMEDESANEKNLPGSRINISEGDISDSSGTFSSETSPAAGGPVFMGAQPDDSDNGLGNISELFSARSTSGSSEAGLGSGADPGTAGMGITGIDQKTNNGYNKTGDSGSYKPAYVPAAGSGSDDVLPDLDSMVGAFMPASTGGEPDNIEYSVSGPAKKPSSRNKEAEWAGDFNAKEIANGIRTVLSKDKDKEG